MHVSTSQWLPHLERKAGRWRPGPRPPILPQIMIRPRFWAPVSAITRHKPPTKSYQANMHAWVLATAPTPVIKGQRERTTQCDAITRAMVAAYCMYTCRLAKLRVGDAKAKECMHAYECIMPLAWLRVSERRYRMGEQSALIYGTYHLMIAPAATIPLS